MSDKAERLRDEAVAFFKSVFEGVPAIALTLTFNDRAGRTRLTRDAAQGAVRHLRRRINRVSRSRKFGERYPELRMFAVLEGDEHPYGKRVHYHLMIEVPPDYGPEDFARFCIKRWRGLAWGAGSQVFASVDADSGWIDYVFKLRDKPLYSEAIDWLNSSCGKPLMDCRGLH